MEYRHLTGAGLKVSRLCLGTMMFGGQTNEADSLAVMDAAYERGVNFFDTADSYNDGASERVVGLGLKGRRNRIVLATKVGMRMGDGPNDGGLSRGHIIAACEASLKRLGTDYIDLYYMHKPDYDTPLAESLEAMSRLVEQGKIRYAAVSNFAAWQIADALALCERRGLTPPVVTQDVCNLLTRGIESELVPFLDAHPVGMVVYNPIAAGLLTGKHRPGAPAENTRFALRENYYRRYWSEENFAAVERLSGIAADSGLSLLQLALRWCLQYPHVDSVITGVSRLDQLEQNLAAAEGGPLAPETLQRCDGVWKSLAGTRFQYNR